MLVFSDASFADATALGNVLADYVDEGGAVVLATFATDSTVPGGRFQNGEYFVIVPQGATSGMRRTLVPVVSTHPLLQDVDTFDGGSSSFGSRSTAVTDDATIVATWNDGAVLVAFKEINGVRRVDLGFYPVSSDARSDFWEATTDGAALMANALLYAMNKN